MIPVLNFAYGQADCSGGRYYQEIFSGFELTSDITYGQNYNVAGNMQSLEMDVYEPSGDNLSERPLIVLIHGGSFLFGDKTQADVKPLAEMFAKRGYVCASMEYRLGMENFPIPGPDSTDAMEAVVRAVQDAKACVRYFYKDASAGNTYGIDTNRIYLMGSSAGAFTALHYAYLEDPAEIPSNLDTTKQGLTGGLDGDSGNPGYSSEIHAVVNFSGALGDTAWIQPGDQPLMSLHGTNDGTVPYGTAQIVLIGVYNLLEIDGSASVHQHMDNIGVDNCFYTWQGADHVPYVGNAQYTDTLLNLVVPWLAWQACGGTEPTCDYILTSTEDFAPEAFISVFPNPTDGILNVLLENSNAASTPVT